MPATTLAQVDFDDAPAGAHKPPADSQQLELHKRQNEAWLAQHRRDSDAAAAPKAHAAARGHEYDRRVGEAYAYDSTAVPGGLVLLRRTRNEVILAEVLETEPAVYVINGDYFRCDLLTNACLAYDLRTQALIPVDAPPRALSRALADVKAGRLSVFSNAAKLLSFTPW